MITEKIRIEPRMSTICARQLFNDLGSRDAALAGGSREGGKLWRELAR